MKSLRQEQGGCRSPAGAGAAGCLCWFWCRGLFDAGSLCGTGCAAQLRFVRSLELSEFMSLQSPLGVVSMGVSVDMQVLEQQLSVMMRYMHFDLLYVIMG